MALRPRKTICILKQRGRESSKARKAERAKWVQERRAKIASEAEEAASMAAAFGLIMRVCTFQIGKNTSFHWIFSSEDDGRVLEYWPVLGTWWNPTTNEKGKTLDWEEAIRIADSVRQDHAHAE